jgi:hypothetical protein
MSEWINHVKRIVQEKGISYKDAMKVGKESYHKGSASKTHSGEDFEARRGTKSKTHKGLDYESESDEEGGSIRIRTRRGGAVGDIPIVPSNIPSYGNTNLGLMRVPQSRIPYQVVNSAGETKRPRLRRGGTIFDNPAVRMPMRGAGVINELPNQNYISQLYNQKNLGADGIVRL